MAFITELRKARAQARLGAEMRVYRDDPKFWLTHVARSKPDREGWTAPPPGVEESDTSNTLEARLRELDELDRKSGSPPLSD